MNNEIYIDVTYSQFKAFHAVAIERSFQRAAERLGLTQPAISIQVRNLERESKQLLFRRKGPNVELTEQGRSLYERTAEMFAAEEKCKILLSPSLDKMPQVLHLGADGPHVALDLIKKFNQKEPDVQVRVTLANADQTWRNLQSLKVDAVVMANAQPDKQVISQVISLQGLVALIPRSIEFRREGKVSLAMLAHLPFIFREPGSNTQRVLERALADEGVQVSPHLVMGSREGVREAVERGLGVGFLFSREAGSSDNYYTVPIKGMEASNRDMLLCLKEVRHTPLVKSLFSCA